MAIAQIDTAEDLAAWMERMNLSLTAAAIQLGRKRATISGYINGLTEMPQSVGRHAAIIEAARHGRPFPGRPIPRPVCGPYEPMTRQLRMA
jgi:DNA-binding CsgD family transcriptional regulator